MIVQNDKISEDTTRRYDAIAREDIEQGPEDGGNADIINNDKHIFHTSYCAVIEVLVPESLREYFTKVWSRDTYRKVSAFKGFQKRQLYLTSGKGGFYEYFVIMVFDDFDSFTSWQQSNERNEQVAILERYGILSILINAYGGGTAALNNSYAYHRIVLHNTLSRSISWPMPPPKWKLVIIIFTAVYCSLLVKNEGSLSVALQKANQPPGFNILVGIVVVVLTNSYATLPLMMASPWVNKWLRARRGMLVTDMHPLHSLLDQGLLIFAAETQEGQVPPELLQRLSKLEAKCDKLRETYHILRRKVSSQRQELDQRSSGGTVSPARTPSPGVQWGTTPDPAVVDKDAYGAGDEADADAGAGADHPSLQGQDTVPSAEIRKAIVELNLPLEAKSQSTPITMAVKHFVKWESVLDFEKWTDEIVSLNSSNSILFYYILPPLPP